MPPLSPLLHTSTPTQDTFTHAADILLPNLTTLQSPPHRVNLLAPSRSLIDASITSYPAYSHAWTTFAHSHSLPLIYTSYVITLPLEYAISSSGTHTQDTFTHTGATVTLLPNLTTLQDPPHLIILLALSRALIDLSITISALIYGGFRPTTTLKSLPPSIRRLCFTFKSVGKRTQEKTLRSATVVCPAIEKLEIEGEGGEERWSSVVPHFKTLQILVICKPGTAKVETAKEELDERLPLPKRARTHLTLCTIGHSDHSMVVSERACAAHLANACPALQSVVFSNRVQWRRPSSSFPLSRPSLCLPFDDLFVKKIDRDVPPPPPLRKVVPLAEQSDDNDSLFFKPSPRKQNSVPIAIMKTNSTVIP
ncbi:hypothetical protein EDD85DRAFT_940539 [Armillaria nabsnona]|nr:hypothetical protein EDD85DRAFT_940539 [Armillaria nabsnona]